jgi:hypothetical protein
MPSRRTGVLFVKGEAMGRSKRDFGQVKAKLWAGHSETLGRSQRYFGQVSSLHGQSEPDRNPDTYYMDRRKGRKR